MIRQVLQGLLSPRFARANYLAARQFSENKKPDARPEEEEDELRERTVSPDEENEYSGIAVRYRSQRGESS